MAGFKDRVRDTKGMVRVALFNALAALPVILLVVVYVLPTIEQRYTRDRRDATRIAVESVFNILTRAEERAASGVLSREAAQAEAMAQVKALRYNKDDYFWINDLSPRMLMHPIKPEMDGQDLAKLVDPSGKKPFIEMVAVCQKDGEGSVEYLWPKPGRQQPVRKTSFVKLFKPWGWIIGNGVYTDDVEADLAAFRTSLLSWLALCVGLSLLIAIVSGVHYARATTRAVRVVTDDLSAEAARLIAAAGRIDAASQALTAATSRQSAAIEETAASTEEMGAMLAQTAHNSAVTLRDATAGQDEAKKGKAVVTRMVDAMGEIRGTNDKLATIVRLIDEIKNKTKFINDIAFETRLLSLNASIEAARAGAHGRGFAVVAEEVGKLALVSNKAADEVRALLDASSGQVASIVAETRAKVESGQQTSLACATAFEAMERELASIARAVAAITQATKEQETGIRQTGDAMGEMERSTQTNAQSAAELARAARHLLDSARALSGTAKRMQSLLAGESAPAASPRAAAPTPGAAPARGEKEAA